MATIGDRIRKARELHRLGSNELNRRAELGDGTISRLESGSRGQAVSVDVARKIAKALGVHNEWLQEGIGPMEDGPRFEASELPEFDDACAFAAKNERYLPAAIAEVRKLVAENAIRAPERVTAPGWLAMIAFWDGVHRTGEPAGKSPDGTGKGPPIPKRRSTSTPKMLAQGKPSRKPK